MSDKPATAAVGGEKKTVLKKVRKVVKPKPSDAPSDAPAAAPDATPAAVATPPRTPTAKDTPPRTPIAKTAAPPAPRAPSSPAQKASLAPVSRRLMAPTSRSSSSIETASHFDPKTIAEFKEAFTLMDQDGDGVISKNDLRGVYAALGVMPPDDEHLDAMLAEAPGPLNFAIFLTLFGERLTGCDAEDVIVDAFKVWDKPETGFVSEELLLDILQNRRCDPFSEEEIKAMYKGKPPIKDGQLDFKAFAHQICTGVAEEMAKM